ncbi:MAG: hypothetical protein ACH350_08780 [Parachlamydiaceae bacterium]
MNTRFNPCFPISSSVYFIVNNLSLLTGVNKKTIAVALAVITSCVAYYGIIRYFCVKAKQIKPPLFNQKQNMNRDKLFQEKKWVPGGTIQQKKSPHTLSPPTEQIVMQTPVPPIQEAVTPSFFESEEKKESPEIHSPTASSKDVFEDNEDENQGLSLQLHGRTKALTSCEDQKFHDLVHRFEDNSDDCRIYHDLANFIEEDEWVVSSTGVRMDRDFLFFKVIELASKNEEASKESLFEAYRYFVLHLKDNEVLELNDHTQMTKRDVLIALLNLKPDHVEGWKYLLDNMDEEERVVRVAGKKMSKKEIHLQLIHFEPKVASHYFNLALSLSPDETIKLLNQTTQTPRTLLVEAIKCDPTLWRAYSYLGRVLLKDETIQLNGENVGPKELQLQAIKINLRYANAYFYLGDLLDHGETIELPVPGKKKMDKKGLFAKAIALDKHCIPAYGKLYCALKPGETITLGQNCEVTRKDLLIDAIQFASDDPWFYKTLGLELTPGKKVILPSGEEMDDIDLLIKAIHLDQDNPDLYCDLGDKLPVGQPYLLRDKNKKNEIKVFNFQLYFFAILMNPKNPRPYVSLAKVLPSSSQAMHLPGILKMTPENLLKEALKLDPSYEVAKIELRRMMRKQSPLLLVPQCNRLPDSDDEEM